jgi:hypothetical protein
LARGRSDPHPSTRTAGASKALCGRTLQARCETRVAKEPGHKFPSQAGTSCEAGTSTARTWDGQPSPSGVAPGARQAAIGRSLRRSPGGPSTLTSPLASRPSGVRNLQRRKASVRAAKRARRSRGPGPSHASAESRARAHASTAGAAANSPSLTLPPEPNTLGLFAPCECSPSM